MSKSVWMLFYGQSLYGPSVLTLYIYVGLITGLFVSLVSIVQVLKDYKTVFISLVTGVILKFILNDNLIIAFCNMGLPAYYGVITASIISYFVSAVICLLVLKIKYKINYESLFTNLIDIVCGSVIMLIMLYVLKFIIPIYSLTRINNIFIILIYTLVGTLTYFIYSYKSGLIKEIFGSKFDKIIKK